MREAARIGAARGYDEINLNIGCPSDRVQAGRFGACLMREPDLVAALWAAAREGAPDTPVTIKCRIGVDEQDPREALFALVDACSRAGCTTFIVHARKAWLSGLSPKENRDVPPLDYALVRALKRERPALEIILNGGLRDLDHALSEQGELDGVMLGRAAYQNPALLLDIDARVFGAVPPSAGRAEAVLAHIPYIERMLAQGTPLHAMTRHMLGLFNGLPGGRAWRRTLSEEGVRAGAGGDVVRRALDQVMQLQARAA
jgi:tRNA-dihydrouridine synthase A